MKKLYITLTFMLATMVVMAQNKNTEEADKLFARFEYVDAAKEYLRLKSKDPYVYKQLAESYYNVYNSKEAVKWYAKAIESKQDAETYYRYAQMLKAEGKYEEANKQMQKFASMAPKDQRAVAFNQDPDYLPKLKSQTKLFEEKILDINDKKYADFGAVLVDNTLYFTSARNTARRTYGRNEEPFLDMYAAPYNSADGTFAAPVAIEEINSKFHDGPAAVTADGNTMYFSSESFKEGDYEKDTPGQRTGLIYLFVATRVNGKWANIKAVPFNGKTWSTGNPSISKDGKTLYFASNRKGSVGATDIWKVTVKGNNTYSEPENLGKKVNTEGNENFPFIADNNKLYFASDGRKGVGAMDIYVKDMSNDSESLNIGLPVNSPQDDFAFTFNMEANKGFFSSNRGGNDDLYLATPICGVDAVVMVTDSKTGKPLVSANVAILDERNNVIETRKTNTDGWVTYSVDCNKAYSIVASADGYKKSTYSIAKHPGGKLDVVATLDPIESLIVNGEVKLNDIYFEFDKSNITQQGAAELDKLVVLMEAKPELVIMAKAHTDNRGSEEYNLSLSDRRARAVVQYVISNGIAKERISGKGYGESEPRVKCEECTEEEHAQNRRNEFLVVKK
jgi:outer membrane protein OmpA-like peptidoglycan-associated protein